MVSVMSTDWQVQKKSWDERLQHILQTPLFTDCKFRIQGENHEKNFEAHKVILAMSSPVFEVMFFGSLPEVKEILINDITPESFEIMLTWIYTSKVNLTSVDEACNVIYSSKKYSVISLITEGIKYIERTISPSTALQVYEFGKYVEESSLETISLEVTEHAQYAEEELLQGTRYGIVLTIISSPPTPDLNYRLALVACSLALERVSAGMGIVKTKTEEVLTDPSFTCIRQETLSELLDLDSLHVKGEVEIFEAIIRWAKEECIRKELVPTDQNKRHVVGNMIVKKIRFQTFTVEQFGRVVGNSDFLTPEEKLMIYNYLSCPSKHSWDPEFSSVKETRDMDRKVSDWYSKLEGNAITCPLYGSYQSSELTFYTTKQLMLYGMILTMDLSKHTLSQSGSQSGKWLLVKESQITVSLKSSAGRWTGFKDVMKEQEQYVTILTKATVPFKTPILLVPNTKYILSVKGKCIKIYHIQESNERSVFWNRNKQKNDFDPFLLHDNKQTCICGFIFTVFD